MAALNRPYMLLDELLRKESGKRATSYMANFLPNASASTVAPAAKSILVGPGVATNFMRIRVPKKDTSLRGLYKKGTE